MNPKVANGHSRWRRQLLLAIGITITLTVLAIIRMASGGSAQPQADPVRQAAWDKIAPRLSEAEQASANASDKYAERVKAFFAERKLAARPFAEAVLSFSGKWQFVKSKLPFAEEKSHERFLQEAFERHLFKSEDVKDLIEHVITGYVSELQGIENELLVAIRADLRDGDAAPPDLRAALQSGDSFQRAYDQTVELILPVISQDMKVTVGREVASFVAADIAANVSLRILTAVTARLGVSAGILGTGAALGFETLGVGLAAAFVADMGLDWIIHEAGYDPEGDVAGKVCETLDKVQTLLLEGDSESGTLGLRAELQKLRQARSNLCNEALKKLILEGAKS
jgi:hypothetical protein